MATQLLDMMKRNQKRRKDALGREVIETTPMKEVVGTRIGLRSQPTDAVATGQLGGTPKQQDMAAAKQTQEAAMKQAFQPLSDRLDVEQRQQKTVDVPESGDTVAAARSLIESASLARQQQLQDVVQLPEEVKRDPAVAGLISQFQATQDPNERARLAEQIKQVASQSVGQAAQAGLSATYQEGLQGQDVAAQYFEDPAEYDKLISTILAAGIDIPNAANMSFADLEAKVQEYSDSVTGQVDQALEMLNDPNAPVQLKEEARQALRDLGAAAMVATDRQLENLGKELESVDEYTVTVDGREVTGNLAQILEDPVVSTAASALLAELTSVQGATPQERDQAQRELVQRKMKANPDLAFLYQSVANNVDAYEAVLEKDVASAKPAVEVLNRNEQKKQELIDRAGAEVADILGLGLQLEDYSNKFMDKLLDKSSAGNTLASSIRKMSDNGLLDSTVISKLDRMDPRVAATQAQRIADQGSSLQEAVERLRVGDKGGQAQMADALKSLGVPENFNNMIQDARRHPSRYSKSELALLRQLDPDNNGVLDPEKSDVTVIKALLEGADFNNLPRVSSTESMKAALTKQANGLVESKEYTRLVQDATSASRKPEELKADLPKLQSYVDQLREMYRTSPADVRDQIKGQLESAESILGEVAARDADYDRRIRVMQRMRADAAAAAQAEQEAARKEEDRKRLIEKADRQNRLGFQEPGRERTQRGTTKPLFGSSRR